MPSSDLHPDEAWSALQSRDASYEGRFVYGVATTGVYCRPGCASRVPLRENVRFFRAAAGAEAAGFRPCKRCRPHEDGPRAAEESVERAREYLEAHLDERVTLAGLARVARMSAYHLQRTFKRQLGVTPREYVQARRADRLKGRLRAGGTVTRATFDAGYGSASRVYDQADSQLGMTPATYGRGGRGMRIRFETAPAPGLFGRILVAETERGVCMVALGEKDDLLEADLRREYPNARVERAGAALSERIRALGAYLGGSAGLEAMPLDVQASVFQRRVWKALQEIPHGETRSYREVAEAIGEPGSARAVARACASNRVALVVPCHRVVRQDGELSGYRWGVDRKARLLELEADGGS